MIYGVNGSFTDSPGEILQAVDKQCGYVVGTGVANWAKSRENLGQLTNLPPGFCRSCGAQELSMGQDGKRV